MCLHFVQINVVINTYLILDSLQSQRNHGLILFCNLKHINFMCANLNCFKKNNWTDSRIARSNLHYTKSSQIVGSGHKSVVKSTPTVPKVFHCLRSPHDAQMDRGTRSSWIAWAILSRFVVSMRTTCCPLFAPCFVP